MHVLPRSAAFCRVWPRWFCGSVWTARGICGRPEASADGPALRCSKIDWGAPGNKSGGRHRLIGVSERRRREPGSRGEVSMCKRGCGGGTPAQPDDMLARASAPIHRI